MKPPNYGRKTYSRLKGWVYIAVSLATKFVVNLVSLRSVTIRLVRRGTSLIAQVWVYSSQALAKLSNLPDPLLGHADGRGHDGAVEHLGVVAHLGSFIKLASVRLDERRQ